MRPTTFCTVTAISSIILRGSIYLMCNLLLAPTQILVGVYNEPLLTMASYQGSGGTILVKYSHKFHHSYQLTGLYLRLVNLFLISTASAPPLFPLADILRNHLLPMTSASCRSNVVCAGVVSCCIMFTALITRGDFTANCLSYT